MLLIRGLAKNRACYRRRLRTIESLEARCLLAADLLMPEFLGREPSDSVVIEADLTVGHDRFLEHLDPVDDHEHDPFLRYGASGNPYYFDPAPDFPVSPEGEDGIGDARFDPREVDLPILHSNPSATKKIFLDFDGHIVTGTSWNFDFHNGNPIHALPYSIDSNYFTFSQTEANNILEIWQRVAEDFAPFDVDVTTEAPPLSSFTQGNRAIRVLISTDRDAVEMGGTGYQWISNAGGVAYFDSWSWTSDTPVWVFWNNLGNGFPKYVAEASSHEVGHALNLRHDGVIGGATYYAGHGSGPTGWAPIMGVGYYQNLTQWSKGEYPNANQTEDDLAIMTIASRIPYRVDDHSSVKTNAAAATPLTVNGTSVSASGIIERNTDVDVFSFTLVAPGNVTLNIIPAPVGPNLDIQAELFNGSGTLVASSNPVDSLNANIHEPLPAGTYTLAIDGVGKGNLATGYSGYASLGEYFITGSVTNQPSTTSTYYVSIATNGMLRNSDGTRLAVKRNDIVQLTVLSSSYRYEMYFQGSHVGLTTAAENITGFQFLLDGSILVSTKGAYSVRTDYVTPGPGSGSILSGAGEDILRFVPTSLGLSTTGSWEVYFKGRSVELSGAAESIDAFWVLDNGTILVSTFGVFRSQGIVGTRSDLFAFTPSALGPATAGTWSVYFKGANVGLTTGAENIDSLQVEPRGGGLLPYLYFSTTGAFSVPGVSGKPHDVMKFTPSQLGNATAGTFDPNLAFRGANVGLQSFNIDGWYQGIPANLSLWTPGGGNSFDPPDFHDPMTYHHKDSDWLDESAVEAVFRGRLDHGDNVTSAVDPWLASAPLSRTTRPFLENAPSRSIEDDREEFDDLWLQL